MKKLLLLLTIALFFILRIVPGQNKNYWTPVNEASAKKEVFAGKDKLKTYKLVQLDINSLKSALRNTPLKQSVIISNSSTIIYIPNLDGRFEKFKIVESPVVAPALAAKYPDIRTYSGQGIDNSRTRVAFKVSPNGFNAMIISPGKPTEFIKQLDDNGNYYKIYSKTDIIDSSLFNCGSSDWTSKTNIHTRGGSALRGADDGKLRYYRLALACTAEFSNHLIKATDTTDNQKKATVMDQLMELVNQINHVYEPEVGIYFNLIDNNDKLIKFDLLTDPWIEGQLGMTIDQRNQATQTFIDTTKDIGNDKYDIGHLLSYAPTRDPFSGASDIGTVTISGKKAKGFSNLLAYENIEPFFHLVCHEIGHQFNAQHTFTYKVNPVTTAQMKPGTGSTIMGYAGSSDAGQFSVQFNSDEYFHAISIEQITDYAKIHPSGVPTNVVNTNNITPFAYAGPDKIIPRSTPFVLTGTSYDLNVEDHLRYSWEQMDIGGATQTLPNSFLLGGPLFRSMPPSDDSSRIFPPLYIILDQSIPSKWEVLPAVARELHFRFTVRDDHSTGPNNNSSDRTITVTDAAGPFKVTSPNNDNIIWKGGSVQTITWNVKNTNLPPVNCLQVRISLSLDGGHTYPVEYEIVTNNDGTEDFTLPHQSTNYARIKISAVGNVFFDICDHDFTINNSTVTPKIWFKADAPIVSPGTLNSLVPGIDTAIIIGDTTVAAWFSDGQFTVNGDQYSLKNPTNNKNLNPPFVRMDDQKRAVSFGGHILQGNLNQTPLIPGQTKTIMVVGQIACNEPSSSPLISFEDDASGTTHTNTKMSIGISRRNNKTYAYTNH